MQASTSHDVLEHLSALVAFDTRNPPRAISPGGIDRYVCAVLEQVGFTVSIDEIATGCLNILAIRGRPTVLFHVHLDTVPEADGWTADPWTLRSDGTTVIGLGACDIKGAAAALLAAFSRHTDVDAAILFTTDEEAGSSQCVRGFLTSNAAGQFDIVVVAEPTGNRAVFSHRGLTTLEVSATGRAGHSSTTAADNHASAIHRLVAYLHASMHHVAERERCRASEDETSLCFNIGVIEGGAKPNMIAASASARCGFRAPPGVNAQTVLQQLQEIAAHFEHIRVLPKFNGPALAEHKAARCFADRAGLPIASPAPFWTEAGLFAAAGHPSLVVGPGNIAQAHTPDEWVRVSELKHAADVYHSLARIAGEAASRISATVFKDTGALPHECDS